MNREEKTEPTQDVEVVKPSGKEQTSSGIILARQLFPQQLPIVPLHGRPVFPKMMVPMLVEDPQLKSMLREQADSKEKFAGLILVRETTDTKQEEPSASTPKKLRAGDLYTVGIVAEIIQYIQSAPDVPAQVLFSCHDRFRVHSVLREEPTIWVRAEYMLETEMSPNDELKAYAGSVIKGLKELMQLNPLHKEELHLFMSRSHLADPARLADFAAAITTASGAELQEILELFSIRARLRKVFALLRREIEIAKIQVKISKQIEEKISKQQRQFFLHEQLKEIKKELGLSKEGKDAELERYTERLKSLELPKEAADRIQEELEKFKLMEQNSPEFTMTRSYLDWLTLLPWGIHTKDSYDIGKALRILNHDHFGLEDVKERILEFLSVGIMKGNISGSILCFVGPPGVGKTSIGHSIARSIGRNFYRFSLGGMRDEAEIKGHRRTYIGALPGKFIQAMKTCKSANPVIMLDEIDKIGSSYQGDPASALLEVLDPEQNSDFLDHYLDVRFDLSDVFFICTANVLDTIPRPLLDRMEVIKLSGYIMEEKLGIARRFLVPKQWKEHGLRKDQVKITPAALRTIINDYAREPGVRSLENQIKKIARKSVKQIVAKKARRIVIDKKDVQKLLGRPLFTDNTSRKSQPPGVVIGLAWTSLGGDIITVEATKVKTGKDGFKQTGQLGSVMVESSEIAYTFIRAFLSDHKDARTFFGTHLIHLHVPAGATPKDGPSAGITMATALYSLFTGKQTRRSLAMTGELTLTGRIMPIGGVKEKTIAAKRNGIRELIFPPENKKDFDELPAHIRKGLVCHFVTDFRDVVTHAF